MFPSPAVRRDQFYPLAGEGLIQAIRLIGVVANEPYRLLPDKPLREGRVDQGDFVWRGTLGVSGDRESPAIGDGHDLRALAAIGLAHAGPAEPLSETAVAETSVAATKLGHFEKELFGLGLDPQHSGRRGDVEVA